MSVNAKLKIPPGKYPNLSILSNLPKKTVIKDRFFLPVNKPQKPITKRTILPKPILKSKCENKIQNKPNRNISTMPCSVQYNKENKYKLPIKIKIPRERSRSARKPSNVLSAKSTPPSSTASNSNEDLSNIIKNNQNNVLKNSTTFSLEANNCMNNPTIRSIKDIKDEYILTKKASESIQSKILNETNHLKYKMLFNGETNPLQFSLQSNINKVNLGVFTSNYENYKINTSKSANFSSSEYRQLLDTYTMLEYGDSILNDLLEKEETISSPLEKHEITPRMRMKMVDWMIEVFSNVKTSEATFFMAVNIMDRYFKYTTISHKPEDLHLIGLVCIFVSSKFCDIYPIKLRALCEKIAHNKYKSEDILQMEDTIMKCLNYDILKPTTFDFMNFHFEDLFYFFENNFNIKNKILSEYLKSLIGNLNITITLDNVYYDKCANAEKFTENMRFFLKCVLNYLLKMCCHDYEIISEKPSLVAASVMLVGMKICEEVNSIEYVNSFFMSKLSQLSKENNYDILNLSSKILYNAQHFEEVYTGMTNLHRTHFATLNTIANTK